MNPKALRRARNRAQVALTALRANTAESEAVHARRLEDVIALAVAYADDLDRDLGKGPSAARRRETS